MLIIKFFIQSFESWSELKKAGWMVVHGCCETLHRSVSSSRFHLCRFLALRSMEKIINRNRLSKKVNLKLALDLYFKVFLYYPWYNQLLNWFLKESNQLDNYFIIYIYIILYIGIYYINIKCPLIRFILLFARLSLNLWN